jgi:4-aminobutyrate aminotransferase-like enzyme
MYYYRAKLRELLLRNGDRLPDGRRHRHRLPGHSSISSNSVASASFTKNDVQEMRKRHTSSSLSVSYQDTGPLMIVEGRGCHLYDERGEKYLDTRNNVAHCGHSHPSIVLAIQRQLETLNTNTRYLHPNLSLLAQRLAGLFPEPLEVVFFTNSGSEANDLALRLARSASGGSFNAVCVESAYHGHTQSCLSVSPYKWRQSRERLRPDHVKPVPCPNVYRGRHRDASTAAKDYSRYVQQAVDEWMFQGQSTSAMIVEGGMSVGGVVLPPRGYLQSCASILHRAGGLLIVDEVQTGFGRLGSCMWAFQYNETTTEFASVTDTFVPDIVTVGKPFGNGMPLAAVVTTRDVAAAFEATGVEYFNTFAGNPVCAAAGLAMLDVLEDEHLQANAMQTGKYLKERLKEVQSRCLLIGDVRGAGLFLGVELVRDLESLEPAVEEASFLCSRLKTHYNILTSLDGPYDNVIVIKPPLVFSTDNADTLAACLEAVLKNDIPLETERIAKAKTCS